MLVLHGAKGGKQGSRKEVRVEDGGVGIAWAARLLVEGVHGGGHGPALHHSRVPWVLLS